MKKRQISFLIFVLFFIFSCTSLENSSVEINDNKISYTATNQITLSGFLGKTIDLSHEGRLKQFINSPQSKAISIFHADTALSSKLASWKGEHAGKWLYAASKSAYRTGDKELTSNVLAVADFLVEQQNDKGYIGTYREAIRFYNDTIEPHQRWDVWITAYLMQGLLEVYRYWPEEKYLNSVKKIGDLCIETFQINGKSLVNSGCFSGMASAGIMENFVDLYEVTKEEKYLDFAEFAAMDLEKRPGVEMITRLTKGYDVSEIGEGKMYEMLRCIVGFAKLYKATGDSIYLHVAQNTWNSVNKNHLAPYGAPWGGIHQHRECFNIGYMFSPYGYSETCAMMDWLRLNKELYSITGEIKYIEEIEKTTYNGIPGAQFPDGLTWTYHSHPNGERTDCGEFACCSSSGTVLLEEIPEIIFTHTSNSIFINIFADAKAKLEIEGVPVEVIQKTNYPFDGKIELSINIQKPFVFPVHIRIPEWAKNAKLSVNDQNVENTEPGKYFTINKEWKETNTIKLEFPMDFYVVTKQNEYNHKGEYIDGLEEFFLLKKGPIVYASNLPDDLNEPSDKIFDPETILEGLQSIQNTEFPKFRYNELEFSPYFMACDRKKGNYKATWLRRNN